MSVLWRSTLVGFLVFCLGFVALGAFWILAPRDGALRGLPTFPSAVWGDGLLLPILAGTLTYTISLLPNPGGRRVGLWGGLLGLIVGSLVIVGWRSDPDPNLNWTMPRAHQFNWAGSWHAAFLVGASALFGALWVELLRRLRSAFSDATTRPLGVAVVRSGPFAAILSATLGYAVLSGYDSAQAGTTGAGLSSLLALGTSGLVLVVALSWAVRRDVSLMVPSSLTGILVAAGMVTLALTPPASTVVALIYVMALAIGFSLAMTAEPTSQSELRVQAGSRGSPALEWIAIPTLFGCVPLTAQHFDIGGGFPSIPALTLLLVLLVALTFRWYRRRQWDLKENLPWVIVAAIFLFAGSGSLILLNTPGLGEYFRPILLTALAIVLSQVALLNCQEDYKQLMATEQSANADDHAVTPTDLHEMQAIWSRVGGSAVAAVAAIISLTIAVAPEFGWIPGTDGVRMSRGMVTLTAGGVVILFVAVLQAAGARQINARRPPERNRRTLLFVCVACVLFASAGSVSWLDATAFHTIAAVQAALVSLFVVESVLGNGARLNLVPITLPVVTLTSLVGVAAFTCVYWALTAGVGSPAGPTTLGLSLLGNLTAMLIVGALTLVATAAAYAEGQVVYLTRYSPVSNAKQDFFLVALLWLVFAWIPQATSEHISSDDPFREGRVFAVFLAIVSVCGATLLWVLRNNDTHLGRVCQNYGLEVPRYARHDAKFWTRTAALPKRVFVYIRGKDARTQGLASHAKAIDGHTAIQNVVALLIVCVTIVGILPAATQLVVGMIRRGDTLPGVPEP